MKESRLMKLAEKKSSRTNDFSLDEEVFARRVRTDLLKILDQINGLRNLQR